MSESVVRCRQVTRRYGQVLAVDGVTFDLAPGEILSILGPSGCGKTTLLRLIAGFESADGGEIVIQRQLVSAKGLHVPPERRHVGMVFQEYALFPHMTVAENVTFGLQRLSSAEKRKRLSELLDLVRLTGLEDRYPHELSGGQQQRVALARTLAPRPVTLLMDEPFSNLDAAMRWQMRQEVESILRDSGASTIFVTHDREEAFAMADRIGVMREGRLVQVDAPHAIYQRPVSPFVARLVGTCDFISGTVQGGVAITEIGALACASSNGPLPSGDSVRLMVHPDDLRASADPSGQSIVQSREFRGGETLLVVRTPSGATLRCRQLSYSTLAPGQRVKLEPASPQPFLAFKDAEDAP